MVVRRRVSVRAWWAPRRVGVAVEVEDDGAVQEPVEHGGGDGGVAEDPAPGSPSAGAPEWLDGAGRLGVCTRT